MSLHITSLIFNTVLIFCQMNTMAVALPSRFSRRTTFLFFNAVGVVLLAACGALALLFDPDTAIYIFSCGYWVPQIAAGLFVVRQRGGQFWCIFFACDVASVLSSTASYVIGSWFFPLDAPNWGMLTVRIGGLLVGVMFAVLYLVPRFKRVMDVPGVPWGTMALAVALMELMILMMVTYPKLIFYRPGERVNLMMVCVVSAVVLSMVVVSLNRVKEAAQRAKTLENQLNVSESYYAQLTGKLQANRIRLHDLRHHLNTLSGLYRQGKIEEMGEYLHSAQATLPSGGFPEYSASGAVNALLDHYHSLCQEAEVDFICGVRLPQLKHVQPLHLCVVIGNALQNAMDALEQLPPGKPRELEIQAVRAQERVVITVRNTFGGRLNLGHNGLPVSTKGEAGHGFGLLSIQETVRRYDGWMGVECKESQFTLRLILKDQDPA